MRALLDVNVLIALLDKAHVHHVRAREWFVAQADRGWASCPITQNGFVRIVSQPRYPKCISTTDAMLLLQSATSTEFHEFWSADLSMLDDSRFDRTRVHGPSQLTDLYLLGLAVARKGRLVTFDSAIPLSAVHRAGKRNLVVL